MGKTFTYKGYTVQIGKGPMVRTEEPDENSDTGFKRVQSWDWDASVPPGKVVSHGRSLDPAGARDDAIATLERIMKRDGKTEA